MTIDELRRQIGSFLGFTVANSPVPFVTHQVFEEDGYRRVRIGYPSEEGDQIPAYLLLPNGVGPLGAVLVHHQHNSLLVPACSFRPFFPARSEFHEASIPDRYP